MTKERFLEILDKHVDQQGLVKDLALEALKPKLDELKAKIDSEEIDVIPGTRVDKVLLLQGIDAIEKYLGL